MFSVCVCVLLYDEKVWSFCFSLIPLKPQQQFDKRKKTAPQDAQNKIIQIGKNIALSPGTEFHLPSPTSKPKTMSSNKFCCRFWGEIPCKIKSNSVFLHSIPQNTAHFTVNPRAPIKWFALIDRSIRRWLACWLTGWLTLSAPYSPAAPWMPNRRSRAQCGWVEPCPSRATTIGSLSSARAAWASPVWCCDSSKVSSVIQRASIQLFN